MTFKTKFFTLIIIGIIGWTSYYDLTHGTLSLFLANASSPSGQAQETTAQPKVQAVKPSTRKIVVQPGDTVLSIEERLNPKKTLSIAQVLTDFKNLNHSTNPNHIQIGHTYVFRIYSVKQSSSSQSK